MDSHASSPPVAIVESTSHAVTQSSPPVAIADSTSDVVTQSFPIVTPTPSHTINSSKVGPTPPEWLMKEIGKENGYDLKLTVAKTLRLNDVSEKQSCLLIRSKNLMNSSFLTEAEHQMLDVKSQSNNVKGEEGLKVLIFDHRSKKTGLILKKRRTNGIWGFVLIKGWYSLASGNNLKAEQKIELWSFRSRQGNLCFGLVSVPNVKDEIDRYLKESNFIDHYLEDCSHLQFICTDQNTIDAPLPDLGSFEETATVVSYF